MNATATSRIDRIAAALPLLVGRLREKGYIFAQPTEVLPGVEPDVHENIQRINNEIGTVPFAVAEFWRKIGSVNLCGHHPDWHGCDYPDPLLVYPSSYAIAELDEFLDDREERMRCNFPFLIPISADDYHKKNVSGGMWYNVDCPATADDPILNVERHEITFLDYVDLALKWGGFSGLENSRNHDWPVEMLTANLKTAR